MSKATEIFNFIQKNDGPISETYKDVMKIFGVEKHEIEGLWLQGVYEATKDNAAMVDFFRDCNIKHMEATGDFFVEDE
jgi:hypothetical protein